MLYLESLGNPRKFSRIARRLSRKKPVVVVKSGRYRGDRAARPPGPASHAPGRRRRRAVPAGRGHPGRHRSTRCSTSRSWSPTSRCRPGRGWPSSATPTRSPCSPPTRARRPGSSRRPPRPWPRTPDPRTSRLHSTTAFADPDVDSVVALFIPPLRTRDAEVADVLARAAGAGRTARPSCRASSACGASPTTLRAPRAVAPYRPTPRRRTRCARSRPPPRYAAWRATPAGHTVVPAGLDVRARAGAGRRAARGPGDGADGDRELDHAELTRAARLLRHPALGPARRRDRRRGRGGRRPARLPGRSQGHRPAPAAPARARRRAARHRRRERAARAPSRRSGSRLGEVGPFAVQRMAPDRGRLPARDRRGPAVRPGRRPSGSAGWRPTCSATAPTRVPPLTDTDLAEMVRSVRAAPLLLGPPGAPAADLRRARGPARPGGPAGRRPPRAGRARAQPGGRRPPDGAAVLARDRAAPADPPAVPSAVPGRCPAGACPGEVQGWHA